MLISTQELQITLHPEPRHQLFRNEPPIFDDLNGAPDKSVLFFVKNDQVPRPRSSSAAEKRVNIPKVVYKSLYLLRHNCRLPALTCSVSGWDFPPPVEVGGGSTDLGMRRWNARWRKIGLNLIRLRALEQALCRYRLELCVVLNAAARPMCTGACHEQA